jgi:hypothetical protein
MFRPDMESERVNYVSSPALCRIDKKLRIQIRRS